jgi:hypothetical protein
MLTVRQVYPKVDTIVQVEVNGELYLMDLPEYKESNIIIPSNNQQQYNQVSSAEIDNKQ